MSESEQMRGEGRLEDLTIGPFFGFLIKWEECGIGLKKDFDFDF